MKNILCFGDSNTYGFVPGIGTRYDRGTRWTGRLAKALGSDYYVIEEGLNGRTNAFDDPVDFDDTKNGKKAFPTILNTHIPLDLVIIMLGSNDLKLRFNATAYDIAKCQARLGEMARRITGEKNFDKKPAEILLVSPIHVGPGMKDTSPFRFEFGERSIALSHELADCVADFAKQSGFHFFDAANAASPSPVDSLHMNEEGHAALAAALADKIRTIIG